MDLRRLRKGEWITAVSGVAVLISLFLPWWDAPDSTTIDGWEALSTLDVALALLGVAALAVWAITAMAKTTAPGVAADALVTPFALVMTVVCLFQVWEFDGDGVLIALLGTVGVLVGVLVSMRDERLSEPHRLTDQTGVPVERPVEIEKLPAPPAA